MPASSELIVICLCAEWCSVCREYRPGFDRLARQHPHVAFHWVDIESDTQDVGDLDVENFPTVLIQRDETVLFFCTMLPHLSHLQRALDAMAALSDSEAHARAAVHADDEAWQLARRLGKRLLTRLPPDVPV